MQDGADVMNALELMDNGEVFKDLKFGPGDGHLQVKLLASHTNADYSYVFSVLFVQLGLSAYGFQGPWCCLAISFLYQTFSLSLALDIWVVSDFFVLFYNIQ